MAATGAGNPDHRMKSLTECVAWVFSDRQGLRQSLLQQLGLKTIHYYHDLHSRQQADLMIAQLQLQKPRFLWVRLAGPAAGTGNKHDARRTENLVRLVRCQMDQGGGVVMEANALSQVWNLASVKEVTNQLHRHRHRWCRIEDEVEGESCNTVIELLTNFKVEDHGDCRCKQGTPHCHEKQISGTHRHERFRHVLLRLMAFVLMSGLDISGAGLPGSRQPELKHWIKENFLQLAPNVTVLSGKRESDDEVPSSTTTATTPQLALPPRSTTTTPTPQLALPPPSSSSTTNTASNSISNVKGCVSDFSKKELRVTFRNTAEEQSYPTENAIRQKEKKAKGHVAKVKIKIVEQHNDDCGTDLTPLLIELKNLNGPDQKAHYGNLLDDQFFMSLRDFRGCFLGSDCIEPPADWQDAAIHGVEDFSFYSERCRKVAPVQVVELFGGKGLTTYLLAKHFNVNTGINFELRAGIDLTRKRDLDFLYHYIKVNRPKMVIMAPPCVGYCSWGRVNEKINPETWARSRALSVHTASVSGNVAQMQVQRGDGFLVEQPKGSGLYQEKEWLALKDVIHTVIVDQCMTGLRMLKPPYLPVRKRTEIKGFPGMILQFLHGLECDGGHQHAQIGKWKGSAQHVVKSSDMQVWPHDLCMRVAAGVHEFLRTDSDNIYMAGKGDDKTKCPGCRGHVRKDDPRHTRKNDCKFKEEKTVKWSCPGCAKNRHRAHPTHTNDGNCQWPHAREVATGGARERRGHHPRDPRVAAAKEPTAGLSDDPARADGIPGRPVPPRAAAPLKVAAGAPLGREPGAPIEYPDDADERRKLKAVSKSSGGGGGSRRVDAETQASTPARTREDGGDGGPPGDPPDGDDDPDGDDEHGGDRRPGWSKFDLGQALQALRSVREGVVRRALRKLHLRWYHASADKMRALLQAAGVSREVVALVGEIVDSCTVCRCWARPGNKSVVSGKVTEAMNELVQIDLLFYKEFVILHMVDATTRWSTATILKDRSADEILTNIDTSWCKLYGPPRVLMSDQEGAVATDYIASELEKRGITLQLVAREQHCGMVERHNEILRRQLHLLEKQATDDGLRVTINTLLGEALYAKNILFRVGNTTPHEAVYGRVPPLLQVLRHDPEAEIEERDALRLRQAAITAMVQATAMRKLLTANRSKTRAAGELQELAVGDLVEVFRRPTTKDSPGWVGPAEVRDLSGLKEGIIYVKWQGRLLLARTQDVRRALVFFSFLTRLSTPLRRFREGVEQQRGDALRLGWFKQGNVWISCEGNQHNLEMLQAGFYVSAVCLHLNGTVGFRFGSSISGLPAVQYDDTLLLWWKPGRLDLWQHCFLAGTKYISLDRVIGEKDVSVVQFFMVDDDDVRDLRVQEGEVPHVGGVYDPDTPKLVDHTELVLQRKRRRALQDTPSGPPGEPAGHQDLSEEDRSDPADDPDGDEGCVVEEVKEEGTFFVHHPPVVGDFFEVPEVIESKELVEPPALDLPHGHLLYVTGSLSYLKRKKDKLNVTIYYQEGKAPFAAIEREHNVLTRIEALNHAEECRQSMTDEIGRWIKHSAWSRAKVQNANNVLKSKWVLKWKAQSDGTKKIKARLVAQGFLDRQQTQTFAGTSTRWSQRLLISTAVNRGWRLVSADVSEAFLRGLTFKELEESGEQHREVAITLPPGGDHILKSHPGYSDFNAANEVLILHKPGFGLKDAPRLWLLALRRVLSQIGVLPTEMDNQLFVKHTGGKLQLVLTVHVDDLKLTGEPDMVRQALQTLEGKFDSLKVENGSFVHLGLRHTTLDDGTVEITQAHYISELRLIPEEALRAADPESVLDEAYKGYFVSLLGGAAWCTQTRPDVCVYISALQRRLNEPRVCDVYDLNRAVKYMQVKPQKLVFRKFPEPHYLLVISDSAYKGEDQDHLAIRSGIVAIAHGTGPKCGTNQLHLLEFVCKKQSRVSRSTFSAELYSALDLVGLAMNIQMAIHEVSHGNQRPARLLELLEGGRLQPPMVNVIDANSVFDAMVSKEVRSPSDSSMLIHILRYRELLRNGTISRTVWVDTRDMLADGLNKGTIDRTGLRRACEEGVWLVENEPKTHAGKVGTFLAEEIGIFPKLDF